MTTPDDPGFDAYKTLQVDPEADPEVIQAAYRRLAQKWHPDVAAGQDAVDRMVAINRAWEMLGDPARRAAYDRERAENERAGRERAAWSSGGTDSRSGSPSSRSTAGSAGPSTGAGAREAAPGSSAREPRGEPRGSHPPERVSRDWTTGRSTTGSGYDPASMRTADETGAAGPPPGNPSGSIVTFGRYNGWSLGEIARTNLEFLEWLDRTPIGRQYRDEIDEILRRTGRRRSAQPDDSDRRGLFRRR